MKPFTKRLALVTGLLFTALICMGIVFIDTTANFWKFSGGFIQLVVNTNAQASITIDTNTLRFGINSNNTSIGVAISARQPATNAAGNGTSASTIGASIIHGATGGFTTDGADATGGAGGAVRMFSGAGGESLGSTINAVGGTAGAASINGGTGGGAQSIATNAITGGLGGSMTFAGGSGGTPNFAATNTVGGNGGSVVLSGGVGSTPAQGWARKGGNGALASLTAGNGGNGVRTNGGNGGAASLVAGNGGSATTGGNPGNGGTASITGGDGSTGTTNSDGGHVFIAGGAPGSGAVPGNVVLARTSAGTSRGAGVQIGPAVGGIATITNVLGAAASLDFPNTVAGTFSDLPITVTGATSNNVAVCLSTPWMCATNGGSYFTYSSNDTIFVRFLNHNLVSAIDPVPGTFSVVGFRIR